MRILFIVATLLLASCSSTPGLSFYSVNNADIASVLKKNTPNLTKTTSILGLSVALSVNDLQVDIGPQNRDVIALDVDSTAEINAFAFKYPVQVALKIEGSPYYDSKKKAVFIKDVALLDSSIDAAGFKGNLSMLDNEFMKILNGFLADNPVYTLDTSNSKVALLTKLPLNIEVVQGAVRLVPAL